MNTSKKTRWQVLLATAGACLAAGSIAVAQSAGETWSISYGGAGGHGGGTDTVTISAADGSQVRMDTQSGNYHYRCSMAGPQCIGRWWGSGSRGWFEIHFSRSGDNFSGHWGYDDDHANAGPFSGSRR